MGRWVNVQLLLRGSRMVIPQVLREYVLKLAHEGHQGIMTTKCRLRSKVWWLKVDGDAEKLCKIGTFIEDILK